MVDIFVGLVGLCGDFIYFVEEYDVVVFYDIYGFVYDLVFIEKFVGFFGDEYFVGFLYFYFFLFYVWFNCFVE